MRRRTTLYFLSFVRIKMGEKWIGDRIGNYEKISKLYILSETNVVIITPLWEAATDAL